MKTQKSILLVLVMFLVGSCASQEPVDEVIESTSTSALPSVLTPTIQPSKVIPPTFTSTVVPTITWTPLPTFSVEEAQIRIKDLLSTNGNCDLPCIWGITPGQTSFQEAISNLLPLVSVSEYSFLDQEPPGDIGFILREGDLELHTRVAFLTFADNNIINTIGFEGRALKTIPDGFEDVFHSLVYTNYYENYMLSSILKKYGQPSSVMISTVAEIQYPMKFGVFELLLLYPMQGILVNYTTDIQVVGENVQGCFSNAHVEMQLSPSGNDELFYETLDPSYWPEFIAEKYKTLEKVTSLNLEEFYSIFTNPQNDCLVTPAKFWPVGGY